MAHAVAVRPLEVVSTPARAVTLTGTLRLVRLALRRDRIILPIWIIAIAGVAWSSVAGYQATMADPAGRAATVAFTASSPIARVFEGAAMGPDLGAMVMVDAFQWIAILVALMSAQAVVRHTRQDEETGRAELLGSAVVGRHARLTAAMVVTLGASLVLGASVAGVFILENLDTAGSLAAGIAVAGVGWAFAGIAAVSSQIFATARGANSAAGAALGACYLIRGVGDLLGKVSADKMELIPAWPVWLSPLGWGEQVRAFDENSWWVAAVFAGATIALVWTAYLLADHRDVGPGMVPVPAGPARAPKNLLSATGLAWRLQRGTVIAWTAGIVVCGAGFGAMGDAANDVVGDNEQMAEMLQRLGDGGTPVELYYTMIMALLGVTAAGFTVQSLLRMRAEEMTGRLEPVLATAVSRRRWLGGHVAIATAGTTVILVLSGLAAGLMYGVVTGNWGSGVNGLMQAALVQIPAALALGGFVVALFGLLPRWSGPLAWAALAVALLMGQLGSMLDLPQWALDISPFTHVPRVPADAFSVTPVIWLLVAAVALGAVGFAAFSRRDLAIGA